MPNLGTHIPNFGTPIRKLGFHFFIAYALNSLK